MQIAESAAPAPFDRGDLQSFAAAFAPALLDPDRETPPLVAGPNHKTAVKRYNVYRNNVVVSLINALADIYPAVLRITGEEFFRAMARFHIRATPPTSPLLFEYGRDFPDFIEAYEFARPLPWLADVARVERAWLDAYHAADFETLKSDGLAAFPPERLAEAVFVAHPATRIVRSSYAALSIFLANRGEGSDAALTAATPEDTLITRPGMEVIVRPLSRGGVTFLTQLVSGETLGVAASVAFEANASFDLAANIEAMIEAGAFRSIRLGDRQ